jgi:hypothetical protein
MLKLNTLAAGMALLVGGLAMSPNAGAVTQDRNMALTGSNMCTLSVPTISTQVRPRATGFRNEGTTNAFVICTFNNPGGAEFLDHPIFDAGIYLYSMDGENHPVTCTGVNSFTNAEDLGLPAMQFVAQTLDVNNEGPFGEFGVPFWYSAEDFGGVAGDPIPTVGGAFSITCNLPPQVGIKIGFSNSIEDVGA